MTRRFTLIQGGLRTEAPGAAALADSISTPPGRARLDAIGGTLRLRLADLPRSELAGRGAASPFRPWVIPSRRTGSIPALAFVGIRPAAPAAGWGDATAP